MDFKLKETQSGTVSKESTEYIKRYHVHSHSLMQRSVAFAFHLEEHQGAINNIKKVSNGLLVKAKINSLSAEDAVKFTDELNKYQEDFKSECAKQLEIKEEFVEFENVTVKQVGNASDDTQHGRVVSASNTLEMTQSQ